MAKDLSHPFSASVDPRQRKKSMNGLRTYHSIIKVGESIRWRTRSTTRTEGVGGCYHRTCTRATSNTHSYAYKNRRRRRITINYLHLVLIWVHRDGDKAMRVVRTRMDAARISTAQTTLEESIATFVNRVVTHPPPTVVTSHLVIGSLLSLIEYYCFGMRVFKTLSPCKRDAVVARWCEGCVRTRPPFSPNFFAPQRESETERPFLFPFFFRSEPAYRFD